MRVLAWSAVLALMLDQISKYLVVHAMGLWRVHEINVFPPLLNFRYGENRGINFGLFNGNSEIMRWVLIAFSVLVAAAVFYWVWRLHRSWQMQVGAGLLIGGALGNVMDRLLYGYVLDFLNMSCCGLNNPFVFNVADVFIFVGAIGLMLFEPRSKTKKAP